MAPARRMLCELYFRGSNPSFATGRLMKFCNSQYMTALLLLLLGKKNAGSESVPGTFLSICLYANNGHITEPLILNSSTSITFRLNWFVLLHRICTNILLFPSAMSPLHSYLVSSNLLLPVTTNLDFLDKVKKPIKTRAHIVACMVSFMSSIWKIPVNVGRDKGAACLLLCGCNRPMPFNSSFKLKTVISSTSQPQK